MAKYGYNPFASLSLRERAIVTDCLQRELRRWQSLGDLATVAKIQAVYCKLDPEARKRIPAKLDGTRG